MQPGLKLSLPSSNRAAILPFGVGRGDVAGGQPQSRDTSKLPCSLPPAGVCVCVFACLLQPAASCPPGELSPLLSIRVQGKPGPGGSGLQPGSGGEGFGRPSEGLEGRPGRWMRGPTSKPPWGPAERGLCGHSGIRRAGDKPAQPWHRDAASGGGCTQPGVSQAHGPPVWPQ